MNNERVFIPDEAKFPWFRFLIAVVINVVLVVSFYYLVAPTRFTLELSMGLPAIIGLTLLLGIPLSFFEYFYHRYLLHAAVLPFMASQNRAHRTHHGLTVVSAKIVPDKPADTLFPVINKYAVEVKEQERSMMFPYWSMPIFFAVFFIILGIPLFLLVPKAPVGIALMCAVTLYYCWYEVWHAILHLPFNRWWKRLLYEAPSKPMWRRIYSFHLMHHLRLKCNEAVVGFWGIAVWDYLFRTHRRPERMPLPGGEITKQDAELPEPTWLIRLLDNAEPRLEKFSRRVEDHGRSLLIRLGWMKPVR